MFLYYFFYFTICSFLTASAQQRRQTDQTIPCEDGNENEIENERSTRSDDGVDYRNSGFMTSVVDQGGCGSCFAFSTCAVLEVFIYSFIMFFSFCFSDAITFNVYF